MAKKIILDKERLIELYINRELTQLEISILLGCSIPTLVKCLKLYNIPLRTQFTDSHKRKLSENHADFSGENNPIYGKPRSDETKRKISEANSNPSDETRSKMSNSHKKLVGELHPNFGKHWKLSEKTKKQFSISRKGTMCGPNNPMYGKYGILNPFFGKHHTNETKKILSEANSNPSDETRRKISLGYRRRGKEHHMYGKPAMRGSGFGKGSYHIKSDGSVVWLRSSYEILFATYLDRIGCVWEYERIIELENDIWHPDFYLPYYDMYVEVKGWLTPCAKRKMIEFSSKYANINIRVIQKKDIDLLINNIVTIDNAGLLLDEYLKNVL